MKHNNTPFKRIEISSYHRRTLSMSQARFNKLVSVLFQNHSFCRDHNRLLKPTIVIYEFVTFLFQTSKGAHATLSFLNIMGGGNHACGLISTYERWCWAEGAACPDMGWYASSRWSQFWKSRGRRRSKASIVDGGISIPVSCTWELCAQREICKKGK